MSEALKPSRERLTALFLSLAALPSPSGKERAVADLVVELLRDLGITVHEDDTGAATDGDTGNLWSTVGGADSGPHLALGAHLDTVAPTDALEPVLDHDGMFRNRRNTILGGDNKCAVAALLHATELLVRSGAPFASYELFFTVSEEQGLVGSKHLQPEVLKSPMAAVLDSSGPIGGVVSRAPSMIGIKASFRGCAAHAGAEPEKGRSAIQAAARAIAAMSLGRLDENTTANIGVVHGGVASNIVPELCEVVGECRGHDESRLAEVSEAIVDSLHRGAVETGVDVDVELEREFYSFALDGRSPAIRLAKAAITELGLEPRFLTVGGGSDANVLNARGLPTSNLATGVMRVHSPQEYLPLDDLERLCSLVLQLIRLAPEYSPGKGRRASAV
jgi:tripeptide aminopeptidase